MLIPIVITVVMVLFTSSIGHTSAGDVGDHLVQQGQSITLTCNTTVRGDVIWLYQHSLTESYVYVYSNDKVYESYRTRFNVDSDEAADQYRLTISDFQLSDSGVYTCKEDGGFGESHMFHVSVSTKHLVSDGLSEADSGSLSFAEEFAGDVSPQTPQSDREATLSVGQIVVIPVAIVVLLAGVAAICYAKCNPNSKVSICLRLLNRQEKNTTTKKDRAAQSDVEMNLFPPSARTPPQPPPKPRRIHNGAVVEVDTSNLSPVQLTTAMFEQLNEDRRA